MTKMQKRLEAERRTSWSEFTKKEHEALSFEMGFGELTAFVTVTLLSIVTFIGITVASTWVIHRIIF